MTSPTPEVVEKVELAPCPFCGGQADVQSESCGWRVVCAEIGCYTCGPWPDDCTEAEAIAAWNTRVEALGYSRLVEERNALERAIDRMGWPEIHAFQNELRKGQDVYEDAGGYFMRAIKALFGIKPSDPVLTYQDAARALVDAALQPTQASEGDT